MKYLYRSHTAADTDRLAESIAAYAAVGTIIALDGDLGAGKTRFSQAMAEAVGVSDVVSSPTFTIIKEYEGRTLPLYHMDVYRVSLEEADELGLQEYFFGGGITLIEWASKIIELLPPEWLHIEIETSGEEERLIRITPHGKPYTDWCRLMEEQNLFNETTAT